MNLLKKNCSAVACQLMYACSLHEKECPCRLCSSAHVTVTWGCALQVTVSTSNSCCCLLQLFRVVAHWVAMRSWSLVRLNTSLERSVEPPLASSTRRKFFRGLITPKLQLQEKQHAHLLGDLPLARSWSLALRARWSPLTDAHLFLFWLPTVPAVRRKGGSLSWGPPGACLNRSLLRAMSRQVPCCHCWAVSLERRAAICIRRLVFASVTSSFGNTKGKLFTKFKKSNGEHLFDLLHRLQGSTDSVCGLSTSSALVSHVHLRPHGGPHINRSRSAAPGNACGQ